MRTYMSAVPTTKRPYPFTTTLEDERALRVQVRQEVVDVFMNPSHSGKSGSNWRPNFSGLERKCDQL